MYFNSFIFILLFLPLTIVTYYLLSKLSITLGKIAIIVASIIFFSYSDLSTLKVLGLSLLINYAFALIIKKVSTSSKKNIVLTLLVIANVLINIGLLIHYKYLNFAITSLNQYFGLSLPLQKLILPIGISFYTFQQISYIVAVYKHEIEKLSLIDYLAYILYFPKILMGPLIEPVDFITQLNDKTNKKIIWDNIACGTKLFSFGLFKKLMLADVFAQAVSYSFSHIDTTTSFEWLLTMLFYTFEIYFDFSGYSDMAVGTSLMLNITLPINFDSPYKALSIRDFWKRWHISLTTFFTKKIYIPLGGSKKGLFLTCLNTMFVFLISGIWHGANWTFILWGALHGIFMIFDRIFEKFEQKIFEPVRWFLSFSVINILWLLFRSDSIQQWKNILYTTLYLQNTNISDGLIKVFALPEGNFLSDILHIETFETNIRGFWMWIYIVAAIGICLIPQNNYRNKYKFSIVSMILAFIAFVWGFICLSNESVFLYFNF